MIKHIKKKFIIVTYLSIFFVVSLIIFGINIYNYTTTMTKHDMIIGYVLNNKLDDSADFEKILLRYSIIIKVENDIPILLQGDDDLNILDVYNYIIKNENKGKYENYYYGVSEDNKIIVLSNYERDIQLCLNFLYNSIIISLIGLSLVYVFIYLLSSYILKPFLINEKLQKEFITNASHELKTPITIIKANLDVLKIYDITNEEISSIESQTTRLEILTNNLISLSKVEEIEVIKTEFSLTDAILEESTYYETLLNERNIALDISISNNITFCGNEKLIRDVIKLLLDNMVKYSLSGESSIYIENNFLYFTNNTNLENGNYDYIFNRFTRIDETRNQDSNSYGIGLSIVKKTLENHNCTVSAYVENKKFYIKIKL